MLCLAVLGVVVAVPRQPWQLTIPTTAGGPTGDQIIYPAGAVAYLRQQGFQGNLITPFVEGAYVSWELWPDVKVSLDSRFDVAYQDGLLEEQERFYRMEAGWQEFLWRYPTDAVLLCPDSRCALGTVQPARVGAGLPGRLLRPGGQQGSAPPLCRLFRPDHPGQISLTSSRKRLSRPDCVFDLPGKPAGVENDVPTPYPCPYPPGKEGPKTNCLWLFLETTRPGR